MREPISPDRQLAFLKSRPPRCLNSFNATSIPMPELNLDGRDAPLGSAFKLSCHLGDNRYKVYAFIWKDKQSHPGQERLFVLPPLKVLTQPNELNKHLFDADNDGYAGELGGSSVRNGVTTPDSERVVLTCPKCREELFELVVRLEYPDDLFEDSGLAAFKGREQELFKRYTLIGNCVHCSYFSVLADFECA